MAVRSGPQRILTFKADAALVDAMEGIPNRSEFIRAAIVAALDGVCPLCKGTGVLSPRQRQHWREFSRNHAVTTCDDCHESRLVCAADAGARV
jgi:hypothetical protein